MTLFRLQTERCEDQRPRHRQFTVAAGEAVTRDFDMHPLGRIYGKLVDHDTGAVIEGHPVSALRKEHFPGYTLFMGIPADPKGAGFDIRNLEAGDYAIKASAPDEPVIALSAEAAAPGNAGKKFYGDRWYPNVSRQEMATVIHLGDGETRMIDITIESRETHALFGTVEAPREFEHQPVSFTFQTVDDDGFIPRRIEMPAPGPFRVDYLVVS